MVGGDKQALGRIYNVTMILDCLGPAKDLGCICAGVMLLITLLGGLATKCLYRLHEGRNVSEESVMRYAYALGFRLLSNCIVTMLPAK